jgi:hypothetical protein
MTKIPYYFVIKKGTKENTFVIPEVEGVGMK